MYTHPEYKGRWVIVDEVTISKIQIDKKLCSYVNNVDISFVNFIVENFNQELWIPILVNPNHLLLDGQHRLQIAQDMGLEFVDVVVQDDQLE